MRWSLIFYLFAAFSTLLAFDGTLALPTPADGAVTRRAVTRAGRVAKPAHNLRTKPARPGAPAAAKAKAKPKVKAKAKVKSKAKPKPKPKPKAKAKAPAARKKVSGTTAKKSKKPQAIKAGHLKKSSATYRKAAMKNPHIYGLKAGKINKLKTPGKMVTGKYHADHILEAQTAAKALSGAGHTESSLGKQKWTKIKNVMNASNNLAMVDGSVNTAKGRICKAGLNGCNPSPADVKLSQGYLKDTKSRGKNTAAEIDKIIGKGNDVQSKQNEVLKKAGVKRSNSHLSGRTEGNSDEITG